MEALAIVIVLASIALVYVTCEMFALCQKIDKKLEEDINEEDKDVS